MSKIENPKIVSANLFFCDSRKFTLDHNGLISKKRFSVCDTNFFTDFCQNLSIMYKNGLGINCGSILDCKMTAKKSLKIPLNFMCKICVYNTSSKKDYNKHLLTSKHQKATNTAKKGEINPDNLFSCVNCDVKYSKKCDFDRHCLTAKHKRGHKEEQIDDEPTAYLCHCGKEYKHRQSLTKHQKKCLQETEQQESTELSDKELIMSLFKQNAEQMAEQNRLNAEQMVEQNRLNQLNAELHTKIIELCKNGLINNTINNNSKTFNLQIYLNETCKDAVNLEEFGKEIIIQLSDLDKIGRIGFVEGMTDIIVSGFNTLAVNKRPIQCTDAKREIFYVKDNDKWEKDEGNKKIRRLVLRMDRKIAPLLVEYENNHANLGYSSDSEIIKHQKIIVEILGGKDNDDMNAAAIIRRLSKKMLIEKHF
jgi:hypothetical protein